MLAFLATFALFATASAQRPNDTSICDYYANKVVGNNTAASQQFLMTLILNTAFLGNYSKTYSSGVLVTGVASVGEYQGTPVNDLPFFDAGYASANDFGTPHGVAKNFLDDGGPVPVSMNLPSNGNKSSNQYQLLTHSYQIFGLLLNCSLQGTSPDFPAYQGQASMYEVHKYMDLDYATFGYFIEQTRLAALSLGFSAEDAQTWFDIQNNLFGFRCAQPTVIAPDAGPQLQTMCIAPNCPLAPNASCGLYPNNGEATPPQIANATLVGNVTTSWTNQTTEVSSSSSSPSGSSASTASAASSSAAPSSSSGADSFKMRAKDIMLDIGYTVAGAAVLAVGMI